jgi:hypothetical protein
MGQKVRAIFTRPTAAKEHKERKELDMFCSYLCDLYVLLRPPTRPRQHGLKFP